MQARISTIGRLARPPRTVTPRPVTPGPVTPRLRSRSRIGTLAAVGVVALAAVLPPIATAALPGGTARLAHTGTAVLFAVALILCPMLVGVAASLCGIDRMQAVFDRLAVPEHRPIIARIGLNALLLLLALGVATGFEVPDKAATEPCILAAALGLAGAWIVFLELIFRPVASCTRRGLALLLDVGLVSALLHFGGATACLLLPLYPYFAISSGAYFGRTALIMATIAGAAGFAAMALVSPFWQAQPVLAAGVLAVLIGFPAYIAVLMRGLHRSAAAAERHNDTGRDFLASLSDDLRTSLGSILHAGATLDGDAAPAEQREAVARARQTARAVLAQIDDIPDLMQIQSGEFAPEQRSFDLHEAVKAVLAAARPQADDAGIALTLRIDPSVPYQLVGWTAQFRQALMALIAAALAQAEGPRLRVGVGLAAIDDESLRLRIALRERVGPEAPEAGSRRQRRVSGFATAERLIAAMGGQLKVRKAAGYGLSVMAELPFGIDHVAVGLPIDLRRQPVWIVTRDRDFAEELTEPIEAWRGEPSWIGVADAALTRVQQIAPVGPAPLLLVDGRDDALQALGWVHRVLSVAPQRAASILFIADEDRIESVLGLADDNLGAIVPAPFSAAALQNAVHAMRHTAVETVPAAPPETPPHVEEGAASAAPRSRDERLLGAGEPWTERRAHNPSPSAAEVPRSRLDQPAAEPPPPVPEAAPSPPPPPPPPPPAASGPRTFRIAIAAENPANRRIIARILGAARHVIETVEKVEHVLDVLAARTIDVVLLDLARPAEDEYRAIREWRRLRPDLAIVALVGEGDASIERLCLSAGVDITLPKPVGPSRMLNAIETAAESRAAARRPASITEIASHPRFAGERV